MKNCKNCTHFYICIILKDMNKVISENKLNIDTHNLLGPLCVHYEYAEDN